jgi:hypothetical protein
MFKSKRRPIVIPQSEHGRLAGTLAALWGNPKFGLPEPDRDSIIAGVALHDRGYGLLDMLAIGELSEQEWLAVTRRGFNKTFSDPIADLIVRYHLRRLVRTNHEVTGRELLVEFDKAIENELEANQLSEREFERLDRITNFCDSIAFDFCFETPTLGTRLVYPQPASEIAVSLRYKVDGGRIYVAPWPFSVPSYSTFIVGYQTAGYPEQLEPLILPIQILQLEGTLSD